MIGSQVLSAAPAAPQEPVVHAGPGTDRRLPALYLGMRMGAVDECGCTTMVIRRWAPGGDEVGAPLITGWQRATVNDKLESAGADSASERISGGE